MTDLELAREMYDGQGALTDRGKALLRQWAQESDDQVGRITTRWTVGVLVADLAGLPALFVATSWPWHSVVATWVVALVMMLLLALARYELACHQSARSFMRRQQRLYALAVREAVGTSGQSESRRGVPRARLAS